MILRRVSCDEDVPSLYGVAWLENYGMVAVCLPVPINLVAGAGRAIWLFMKYGLARLPRSSRSYGPLGTRRTRIPDLEVDVEGFYGKRPGGNTSL